MAMHNTKNQRMEKKKLIREIKRVSPVELKLNTLPQKETPMRNQTPDHQTLLTIIFTDTNGGKEPSVSS